MYEGTGAEAEGLLRTGDPATQGKVNQGRDGAGGSKEVQQGQEAGSDVVFHPCYRRIHFSSKLQVSATSRAV